MRSFILHALTVALFLTIGVSVAPAQQEGEVEYREFTGSNGKKIQAVLVDKTDDQVTLLLSNGSRAVIGYDKLSEADQEYVKSWNKEKAIFIQKCSRLTIKELLEMRGYESFPFQLQNNAILIEGELNGNPAKFLIDTGANSSTLDVKIAQDTGCKVGPMDQKVMGLSREVPAAWTDIEELKMGESLLTDLKLLSIDLSLSRPPGMPRDSVAIFGADFLTKLRGVISYKENRIFLRPDLADGEVDALGPPPDFRLFKESNGKTHSGRLLSKTSSAINLKLESGKELQLAKGRLSEEDKTYVEKWSPERDTFMRHCRSLTVEEVLELRNYQSFVYEIRNRHIFVDGQINETESKFLIDTGAQTSVLDIRTAKETGCQVGPMGEHTVYGIDGEHPAAASKVALVKMGDARFENRTLLTIDMFKNRPDPGYNAIFGADFLREREGVITYKENRMFLR